MAIFHLTAKVISRGKGQNVIASAAYRSGQRLIDEQTGEIKEYKARNERIQFEGVFAPKDAPDWARDRQQLWNRVEAFEKRKDAQLAREIEIALPHELTDTQREWLVKDFVREQFTRKGYAVDVAIHAPDRDSDARNFHAHLLVTMRTLDADGFATKKDRSQNGKGQLQEWREEWAKLANRHLERHGHDARIDHRSLAEQGETREPTIHVGYAGIEMEARGGQSDRMDELRGIMARNDAIRVLQEDGRADRADDAPARGGAFTKRRPLKPEAEDETDRPEPHTRTAKAIARAVETPDPAEARLAAAASPPEPQGTGAPPPREDRRDPRAEDREREDERGGAFEPRHGVRLGGGAIDALSDGMGAMADKAADVLLSLFSSGKEKPPVADEKQQQKGMTPREAWQKAVETSRAANAQREKNIIDRAEQQKHRPLQPNERDEVLRKGDRER
jgi:hypothetical protein